MATQNIFNLTDTWNNVATTFTAIKMNATDTASASGSLLIDLQTSGTSRFSVRKDGFAKYGSGGAIGASGTGLSVRNAADSDFAYLQVGGANQGLYLSSSGAGVTCGITGKLNWSNDPSGGGGAVDLTMGRNAAASLRLGDVDAAAPVAQTLGVQSVAGASNTAGADWTLAASKGTGTGAGGAFLFAGAAPGSSGSSQNAASTQAQLSYYSAIGQYGFYVGSPGAQNAGDIGVYNATRNDVAGLTIRNANAGASAQTYLTFGNSAAALSSSIILNGGNFSGGLGANGLAIVSAATLALYYGGTTTAAVSIPVTSGVVAFGGAIRALTTTVGALPAAATAGAGARAFVTDALAPVFGSAVAGSGAVGVPVYSDGSAWNVG
jgi:hypothetical protein